MRLGARDGHYSHYYVKASDPRGFAVRSPFVHFTVHCGPNHTWNFADTAHDVYWSYFERVTLVLTHLLATFALALYFVHPPSLEYKEGIGLDHYSDMSFFVSTIAIVTFIVSPICYLFACAVRGSFKSGRFRNRYGYFPSYFAYLTRAALLIINVLCLVYLLVYGPFISAAVVYTWVIIVVISLLINIFICENLFLGIHTIVHLVFYRLNAWVKSVGTSYRYKEIIRDVEVQRKFLYRHMTNKGMRPFILPLYEPLSGERLKKTREEYYYNRAIRQSLVDIIRIWILIILIFCLIPFYVDDRSAIFHKHLEDVFVDGKYTNPPMGMMDVYTYEDLYDYLNTTLVKAITPSLWYQPYTLSDSGLIVDVNNKVIGNVRIRQKRTLESNCPIPAIANAFGFSRCVGELWDGRERKKSYVMRKPKHNGSMWWYHEAANPNWYAGFLQYYDGDGYAINIGKTRRNALYRVQILKRNEWLDDYTKFVIVEMLLYNANVNLFADVKLVWESEANFLRASHEIRIAKLLNATDGLQVLQTLLFILYVALSAWLLVAGVEAFVRGGCRGLGGPWFGWSRVAFHAFNVWMIVAFVERHQAVNAFLDEYAREDRNAYVPYSHVVASHQDLVISSALVVTIVILQLLLIVKYFIWSAAVKRAMKKACGVYVNFFVYVVIASVGVALILFVLYGDYLGRFDTFGKCFGFFLSAYTFTNDDGLTEVMYYRAGDIVGWFYFAMVSIVWIARIGLFMVCAMCLHRARKEVSSLRYRYTLRRFLVDTFEALKFFKNQLACWKCMKPPPDHPHSNRQRGGGKEEEIVQNYTPKFVSRAADPFRYRNSVYVCDWKMDKMQQVVHAHLWNNYVRQHDLRLNRDDFELMKGISELVTGPMAVCQELYFEQRVPFQPRTITILVPDERMRRMARVADQFLEEQPVEGSAFKPEDFEEKLRQEPKKCEKRKGICEADDDDDDDWEEVELEEEEKLEKKEDAWIPITQKSHSRQLQGILIILGISDEVLDAISEKLFGPSFFKRFVKYKCCQET